MGTTMQVLAWLVFMGLLGFYFTDLLEDQHNPNRSLETRYNDGVREVVLQRNKHGHYITSGEINGQPVVFMLDTGATGVALPASVAERLGIPRGRAINTQTANGVATSYLARLDSVKVGDIEMNDVAAGITPGLRTEELLLGMSFLRHIEFSQRGDTLTLRQHPD